MIPFCVEPLNSCPDDVKKFAFSNRIFQTDDYVFYLQYPKIPSDNLFKKLSDRFEQFDVGCEHPEPVRFFTSYRDKINKHEGIACCSHVFQAVHKALLEEGAQVTSRTLPHLLQMNTQSFTKPVKITLMPGSEVSHYVNIPEAKRQFGSFPQAECFALVDNPNSESDGLIENIAEQFGPNSVHYKRYNSYVMPFMVTTNGSLGIEHCRGFLFNSVLKTPLINTLQQFKQVKLYESQFKSDDLSLSCLEKLKHVVDHLEKNISVPDDINFVTEVVNTYLEEIQELVDGQSASLDEIIKAQLVQLDLLSRLANQSSESMQEQFDDCLNTIKKGITEYTERAKRPSDVEIIPSSSLQELIRRRGLLTQNQDSSTSIENLVLSPDYLIH